MHAVNDELARRNMVLQQVRPWDVIHPRVLEAMADVPREAFVPEAWRHLAFADFELPLSADARMLPPRIEGRLLQALDLKPGERVLEIGTGSGFFTALMARLGATVTSVEYDPELLEAARARLAEQEIDRVTLSQGNGATGCPVPGPWEAIVITGGLSFLPDDYREALAVGGRLVAFIGDAPLQQAIRITRTDTAAWHSTALFETGVPMLRGGAARRPAFVF